MFITWTPNKNKCRSEYSQPSKDVLRVNDDEFDFTDPTIVEFDIPIEYHGYIKRAWREDGDLHLVLLAHYRKSGDGLMEDVTREYGIGELIWLQ